MAETPDYMPQVGDVVTFPKAHMEINRTMRYEITSVGRMIACRPEDDDHNGLGPYLNTLDELREIGITKAEPFTTKEA